MDKTAIDFYTRLARGLAAQFGSNCEIVIHDLESNDVEHSIVAIENGYITGRKLGDGPSHIVLESLQNGAKHTHDKLAYLTKTKDGKILKSSTIYIRNSQGRIIGILSINYDITKLTMIESALHSLITPVNKEEKPKEITHSVNDLLDHLIEESVALVGKPVALMNKEDKVTAIQFLNDSGAFLITKSGDKGANYFGISKYTLYSYIDVNK